MTPQTPEGEIEEMRTITCRTCGGDGYTVEPSMPDGEPEQVQCNDCHAEGEYTTLDEVRRVLLSQQQKHREELQKALVCGKEFSDGSICGCKLDCHLHDWRQRDELQKARKEERERIKQWAYKRATRCAACFGHKGIPHNHGQSDVADLLAFIDHSELDQDKV